MSAPLLLTADDLRQIGKALEALSDITNRHNVVIGSYGTASITYCPDAVGEETVLSVRWDADDQHYVIHDRIGD